MRWLVLPKGWHGLVVCEIGKQPQCIEVGGAPSTQPVNRQLYPLEELGEREKTDRQTDIQTYR
eukprot:8337134-Prorocentrum_lima.AAC.1